MSTTILLVSDKNLTLRRGACTLVFLDFFCVTNVKQHFNKVNAIFLLKKDKKAVALADLDFAQKFINFV